MMKSAQFTLVLSLLFIAACGSSDADLAPQGCDGPQDDRPECAASSCVDCDGDAEPEKGPLHEDPILDLTTDSREDVWSNTASPGTGSTTSTSAATSTTTTPPRAARQPSPRGRHISGERMRWHTITATAKGPDASESDVNQNPFMDYRMIVRFTAPSGRTYDVPGFYNGDGRGGDSGSTWQARLTPDEKGIWQYHISFDSGDDVGLSTDPNLGTPLSPDGENGAFSIEETDKQSPDFRAHGRILHDGTRYLTTQDGKIWLKRGTNSPENFLGYAGFDNTIDQPGGAGTSGLTNGLHEFADHISDWSPGDPDWNNGAGKGIIGALNYLGDQEVNSFYFLPCNLGGDGRETYPYTSPQDLLHFDLSKLQQWEIVFDHAQQKGLAMHVVLNETEVGNENLHDNGQLGPERMLFYKELVARFGHHLGLFWNIGEENDYGSTRQIEFAGYIDSWDVYDHPTTVHTNYDQAASQYTNLVGNEHFDMSSIQGSPGNVANTVDNWRVQSENAGRPWAMMIDEVGPAGTGLTPNNADTLAEDVLWPSFFNGGAGVEWYFGYHALPVGGDMRTEDFRTRQDMWRLQRHAHTFLAALPLRDMEPDDSLVTQGECIAQPGYTYAIYLESGGSTTLDLSAATGTWKARWFDPDNGVWLQEDVFRASNAVTLTPPQGGDIAVLVEPN
jgi:hypothetical protein